MPNLEQPQLFRFNTVQPKGAEEMMRFAQAVVRQRLMIENIEETPCLLEGFFVFSDHYDGGLDVLPTNVRSHEDGTQFLECFSGFARSVCAHGTLTISPMSQLLATGPLLNFRNREDLLFVMAQTLDGEERVSIYELQRDSQGLIEGFTTIDIDGVCKVS